MSVVALTMRHDAVPGRAETRDAVETSWWEFLALLGHTPLVLPNHLGHAVDLVRIASPAAAILTGGGEAGQGPPTGRRDDVEAMLLGRAVRTRTPLVGVCRGMQALAMMFGSELIDGAAHVRRRSALRTRFGVHRTNCYHDKSLDGVPNDFLVLGATLDGVVEAIEHRDLPICGVMWHPERAPGFDEADVRLFREVLNV